MVWFDFQVVRPQFKRHMPVTQVVSRAREVESLPVRHTGRDAQHSLWRGDNFDHRTVFSHQHVTATHQRAAL